MATISVPLDRDKTVTLRYSRVAVKYTLTTRVLADSTEVGIPSGATIDGRALAASMNLDSKTYTVTVPDRITVGGVEYQYSTHTIT